MHEGDIARFAITAAAAVAMTVAATVAVTIAVAAGAGGGIAGIVKHAAQVLGTGHGRTVGEIELHVIAVAVADANEFLQRHDGVGDHRGARGAAGAEEDIFHGLQRLFIGGRNRALQIRNEAGGTRNSERPVVIGAPVGAHAGADGRLLHLAHPAPGVFDDCAHLRGHRTAFRAQLPRLLLAGRAVNHALDAGEEGNGVGVGACIGNGAALHPAKGGAAVVAFA